MRRSLTVPLLSIAVLLGLTACSAAPNTANGSETIEVSNTAVLLDVRTAEEHQAGHLHGATLLDFNGGDLAAAIPNLDSETEYLVYCRSGNRSGQAIALMKEAGFTNLTNLGSLEQAASATGIDIVR